MVRGGGLIFDKLDGLGATLSNAGGHRGGSLIELIEWAVDFTSTELIE